MNKTAKLLYIPNGEYIDLNITNNWAHSAETLLDILTSSYVIYNTNFLIERNLPLNHKFSREEFEVIYD